MAQLTAHIWPRAACTYNAHADRNFLRSGSAFSTRPEQLAAVFLGTMGVSAQLRRSLRSELAVPTARLCFCAQRTHSPCSCGCEERKEKYKASKELQLSSSRHAPAADNAGLIGGALTAPLIALPKGSTLGLGDSAVRICSFQKKTRKRKNFHTPQMRDSRGAGYATRNVAARRKTG